MPDNSIEIIARGVLRHGEMICLCKNRKHGYLFLPGGHVEFGEPAAAALAREFMEECGLSVRVGKLLAVQEHSFEQKGSRRHEVNLMFHVELLDRDIHVSATTPPPPIPSLEPKIEFVWVSNQSLSQHDVRPDAVRSLLPSLQADSLTQWHSAMAT